MKPKRRKKELIYTDREIEELVDGILTIVRLAPTTKHREYLENFLKARLG